MEQILKRLGKIGNKCKEKVKHIIIIRLEYLKILRNPKLSSSTNADPKIFSVRVYLALKVSQTQVKLARNDQDRCVIVL